MRIPRSILYLAILSFSCRAPESSSEAVPSSEGKKRLTLEQTLGQGEKVDFTGELSDYAWAADGVHLVLTEKERKVWVDPASWQESAPAAEPAKKADEGVASVLLKAGVSKEQVDALSPRATTRASSGGALVAAGGELWWVKDGAARKLASAAEGEAELAELSPDGEHVAFVQANDLVVVDTASGARRELTQDGSTDVLNGKLDWVYQEEVYGRGDFKGFWWSPDSRFVAFLRLDETKVYDFTVVDNIQEGNFRVHPEVTRYPKVGDPNPVVALGIASASEPGKVRWVDLSARAKDEPLVVRVDWAPGGWLLYMLQDRVQTWLELCAADAATAASRALLRETSKGWVNRSEPPRWLAAGTFLLLSERTGQTHAYRYRAYRTLVGAVTSGDWSVSSIDAVAEKRGLLWFTGTCDGAIDRNLYRVGLDGTGLVRLTKGPCRHDPSRSEERRVGQECGCRR